MLDKSKKRPLTKIIFDLDDTLGDTIELFQIADRLLLDLIEEKTKYREALQKNSSNFNENEINAKKIILFEKSIVSKFREYDALEIISTGKYTKSNYKKALIHLYSDISDEYNFTINKRDMEQIKKISDIGFSPMIFKKEGINKILKNLATDYDLYVYTKGEYSVQTEKINWLGIRDYFKQIIVVDEKGNDTFNNYFRDYETNIMIGNSLKSDLLPALSNNSSSILLPKNTWFMEQMKNEDEQIKKINQKSNKYKRITVANDIYKIPKIVEDLVDFT